MEAATNGAAVAPQKNSVIRLIWGSLLISFFGMIHVNFLTLGSLAGISFLVLFALAYFFGMKKDSKVDLKRFHYKTASILSFLLPISAFIYGIMFTNNAMQSATDEIGRAGAATGGAIGSTLIVVLSFIFGLSFGIAFYLMSKKY